MFCTQSIIEEPTRSVNNSLINEAHITATYCTLLALESSSTDWSYWYTCLKLAEKLNTLVSPAQKTIVSLDLQLYSKCIQLLSYLEISQNLIFPFGDLHVMFAVLKTMGKIIDGSGLYQIFIGTRIYWPNTVAQINIWDVLLKVF